MTSENACNGHYFTTEGNHKDRNNKKSLFWVFLKICVLCFNPYTTEYVYLRFSGILLLV